jgi:hypothetical protein
LFLLSPREGVVLSCSSSCAAELTPLLIMFLVSPAFLSFFSTCFVVSYVRVFLQSFVVEQSGILSLVVFLEAA